MFYSVFSFLLSTLLTIWGRPPWFLPSIYFDLSHPLQYFTYFSNFRIIKPPLFRSSLLSPTRKPNHTEPPKSLILLKHVPTISDYSLATCLILSHSENRYSYVLISYYTLYSQYNVSYYIITPKYAFYYVHKLILVHSKNNKTS